jgi:hypothetical protein
MRRPCGELGQHHRAVTHGKTAAGEQQLGHRLQIDDIRLDRALAQNFALLGDVTRVELEQLPPSRPRRRRQQGPVIVARRLDPHLHADSRSEPASMLATTCANELTVIGQPVLGFISSERQLSVTENANSVLPTSTATTTVDDVTGAA